MCVFVYACINKDLALDKPQGLICHKALSN